MTAQKKISKASVFFGKATYAHTLIPLARAAGKKMYAWAGWVWAMPTSGNTFRPLAICMTSELGD